MNATPRRLLSALALTGALALSGCATMSAVQTDHPYQAGDGVNLTVGSDIDARGLMIVGGTEKGGPGRVTGQIVNLSDKAVTVTIATPEGAKVETEVPAHTSANLADDDLTLPSVAGVAGDLVPVTVSTPADGVNVIQVPILPAEGAYADYAPAS